MFKNFFKGIGDLFKKLFGAVNDLIDSTAVSITGIEDSFNEMKDDLQSAIDAVKDFEHFDFDPKWKTRVISLPSAWEGIQDLLDIILHGLSDKFAQLRQSCETLVSTIKMDIAPARTGDEGPSKLGDIGSKLASFAIAVEQFRNAFKEAVDLVQMLDDIKKRMETLDDVFLPQAKKRKWLTERTYKRV